MQQRKNKKTKSITLSDLIAEFMKCDTKKFTTKNNIKTVNKTKEDKISYAIIAPILKQTAKKQRKIQLADCKTSKIQLNYEKIDKTRLDKYLDMTRELDFLRNKKHWLEKVLEQDKEKYYQMLIKVNEAYTRKQKLQKEEYNRLYPNIFKLPHHHYIKAVLNKYFEGLSNQDIVLQEFYNYPDFEKACFKINDKGEKVYTCKNRFQKKVEKWFEYAFKFFEKDYIKTLKTAQKKVPIKAIKTPKR